MLSLGVQWKVIGKTRNEWKKKKKKKKKKIGYCGSKKICCHFSEKLAIMIINTQQTNKRWSCGERDEMVNHERMQQTSAKKFKSRHDWVGKVIHRKLCKRLKFNHITKWYMHKSESVRVNETHKILLDFEIQTDHLIPARRPRVN